MLACASNIIKKKIQYLRIIKKGNDMHRQLLLC